MFYRTDANDHGLAHDPFKAIVAPRPIGWISTRSADGAINLSPYSFFNALSSNPHLVFFSSDGEKDSVVFARESGEFAVNLAGRALAEQMNLSSVDAPRGTSEFGYAGLEAVPCKAISAPRVAGVPAVLECKVTEIIQPRGLDGASAGAHVVMGQVVAVEIDDAIIVDGRFDVTRAATLGRLGYLDYCAVGETFEMARPRWDDPS